MVALRWAGRFHRCAITTIVYMGRGTQNLYTLWTPLGDVPPYHKGPLAILQGSHHIQRLKDTYGRMDVRPRPRHRLIFQMTRWR